MDKSLADNTSKRIRELRLAHGLTMEELGEKVGVSKSTIAKWENGYVQQMKYDMIVTLAKVFDVSPMYISGYDMDKKPHEEEFTELYTQLSDDQKALVDNMIKVFLSKQ